MEEEGRRVKKYEPHDSGHLPKVRIQGRFAVKESEEWKGPPPKKQKLRSFLDAPIYAPPSDPYERVMDAARRREVMQAGSEARFFFDENADDEDEDDDEQHPIPGHFLSTKTTAPSPIPESPSRSGTQDPSSSGPSPWGPQKQLNPHYGHQLVQLAENLTGIPADNLVLCGSTRSHVGVVSFLGYVNSIEDLCGVESIRGLTIVESARMQELKKDLHALDKGNARLMAQLREHGIEPVQ